MTARRHFTPPRGPDPETDPGGRLDDRRKALGELALAVYLARRHPGLAGRREVVCLGRHLAEVAGDHGRSGRRPGHGTAIHPERIAYHLVLCAAVRGLGRPPAWAGRLARGLARDLALSDPPRPAWLRMERRFLLEAAGMAPDVTGWRALYRECRPDLPARMARLGPVDVYVLTHVLFYLSDYARRAPTPFLGGDGPALRHRVTESLGVALVRRDPDLVAELLLASRCLGHRAVPFEDFAWRFLESSQRPGGQIPHADLPATAERDPEAAFHWNYHPTLVTFLAAAEARYGRPP